MTKSRYKPDVVSPPGETLQELLEQQNLSQADLAERMGRPKKTINEIIQGKTALTPETAIQLERVLKTPARFWLAREARYRGWLAEQDEDHRLKNEVGSLTEFPLKEMAKHGWIERHIDKVAQLKELLNFFGVTTIDKIPLVEAVAFRRSEAFATNPWALAAWLRQGELDAMEQQCAPFDKSRFLAALREVKTLTFEKPDVFVPKLAHLCNAAGVAITFTKELPNTSVSGATRWITPDRALMQLSLRYKTNDHFWFSFFHESAHIYLGHAKREILLEDGRPDPSLDPREQEANDFANEFLVPKHIIQKLSKGPISELLVSKTAHDLGIHSGVLLGRLQHEKLLGYPVYRHLKIAFVSELTQ